MTTDVVIRTIGGIARISLNRPRAIHALTLAMCSAMTDALLAWREDPAIGIIILDHAEGRGFCAGGDIRAIAEGAGGEGARAFFGAEYRLNALLFAYPKPIVAVMDGITMGGGVGIALPCRYRIATGNTRFAMPETGIGLFPDVGGGWYLPRLPGQVGKFLALTGARLDGAECLALGLATHFVSAERIDDLRDAIAQSPDDLAATLDRFGEAPPPARILSNRERIDRLFAADTLEEILAALEADPSDWAEKELATLRAKSPLSCKVALRQLREGATMPDFATEMAQEYRLALRMAASPDFAEGVRALLIDRDNAPRWNPATPEAVTDAMVDAIFAPLPAGESWTPFDPPPLGDVAREA